MDLAIADTRDPIRSVPGLLYDPSSWMIKITEKAVLYDGIRPEPFHSPATFSKPSIGCGSSLAPIVNTALTTSSNFLQKMVRLTPVLKITINRTSGRDTMWFQ